MPREDMQHRTRPSSTRSRARRNTERSYAIETELRENRDRLSELAMEIDRARAAAATTKNAAPNSWFAPLPRGRTCPGSSRVTALEAERDSNRQVLESAAADLAAAQHEPPCPSRNLPPLPRRWLNSNTSRKSLASPSLTPCRRFRACAINWLRPKNARRRGIAKPAVCKRNRQRESPVETFGGSAPVALEFEASPSASPESPRRSASFVNWSSQRLDETRAKTHLDVLRAEFATALGKKGSLEAVIAEQRIFHRVRPPPFQSGVMQSGLAPVGVLADFLEVEPRFDALSKTSCAMNELHRSQVLGRCRRRPPPVRSDVDGRATFLVHPETRRPVLLRPRRSATALRPPLHCAVEAPSAFSTVRKVAGSNLPKLRDGYIVPGSDTAPALRWRIPTRSFFHSPANASTT